jgi:hypothetical protein
LGQARADLLITLSGTAASGTNTVYTYNVFLPPGFELDKAGNTGNTSTGNIFTLYDFQGLVGSPTISAALMASGFTTSTIQNTGITPKHTSPTDDPTISNITFKYTKAGETNNPASGMNLFLGQFSVTSTFKPSSSANVLYAAATQKHLPGSLDNEQFANNVSALVGPNAVPEPSTLALCATAIPVGAGFFFLRRRRLQQVG